MFEPIQGLKQPFINATMTPFCIAIAIIGGLAIWQGVKEVKAVGKTSGVGWIAIIGGIGNIAAAIVYYLMWCVFR